MSSGAAIDRCQEELGAGLDGAVMLQQVHSNGACLDDELLADPEIQDAIKNEGKVHREFEIVNTDRATLGRLGGAIAKQHGDSGFAGQISIDFKVQHTEHKLPWHMLAAAYSLYTNLSQARPVCFSSSHADWPFSVTTSLTPHLSGL